MAHSIDSDIDDFFRSLGSMSELTLRHLAAVWGDHENDGRRIAASTHARSIIRTARRQRQLDVATGDLRSWLNGRAGAGAGIFGVTDTTRIEAAGAAIPALVDCILAIVAGHDLTPGEYEVLVLPVEEAVRAASQVSLGDDLDAIGR